MGRRKIDLTGQRFGRLVVVGDTGKRKIGAGVVWKCKCDCGKEVEVSRGDLKNENTKSCGCLRKENSREMGIKTIHKAYSAAYEANSANSWVEGTSINSLIQNTPRNNTSGVKGIWWDKRRNKWVAEIYFIKKHYLGRFINKQDAINARKEAENKYFKPILEKYGKELK